ncbi:MAG: sodium:solute symporter family protein [Bacillota bacterium]|jgi:SSS family solute:Na+ symporter
MWTILDTIIVALFLLAMIGIGVFVKDKINNPLDFFVANREFKWFAAAVSMFATYNSVWAFTGAVGYGYRFGVAVLFFYVGAIIGTVGQTYFLAAKIRATRALTIFGFLEKRFSQNFRYFVAGANSLIYFMDGGMRLYATAIIPSVFLGWNPETTVLALFGVCIIYTVLGGMRSVVMTDVLQGLTMFAVFLFAIMIGIGKLGGIGELGNLDPRFYKLASPEYPLMTGLAIAIPSMVTHFMNFAFHGNRLLAVRTIREAKKANIAYAVSTLLFGGLVVVASLLLATAMPGLEKPEAGFTEYLKVILPTGLLGLFLAGALAATLSTIDSQAHNITGWIVSDIYMAKNPNASNKFLLRLSRAVVALVICGFLGTSSFTAMSGIFNMVLSWLMPLVAPISVILAAGFLSKKTNVRVAWIALVGSYILFIIWKFAALPYTGIAVPVFTLLVVIFGPFLLKSNDQEEKQIKEFFKFIDDNIIEDA